MKDEDETFRLLRRTDFETLYSLVNSLPQSEFREIYKTAADKAVFFLSHGWTTKEFEELAKEKLYRK